KKGTTLEKIARELRNLRTRSDPHKGVMVTLDGEKVKTIKKTKSTSSIRDISRSRHARIGSGVSGSRAQTFDIDEEKRQQLILEAHRQKENRVLGPPVTARMVTELP
ncbi:MAG: hypothetical protein L6R42_011079, partial [Xanthoria sp. 1 TBL-2021]